MANITTSADIHAFLQTASDAAARTELGVDASGTDNSTNVTLAGSGTYISIAGQTITVDGITESDITDLGAYLTNLTGEALSTVSDVTITAVASGEILKWNGTAWINNTLAEAGIAATSHTHAASDITDFDTEVGNNAAVAANTAKVTNATHTGDVTGATVLTIAAGAVTLAMLSATGTASGTTFLRGDNSWATVTGTPEGTAILSTGETVGKVLQADGDGSSSWTTLPGGGDALVANPLSQFASTTSAQLAGVLSDETGSGAAVFATSPTLVTPNLGTPSALVATNATGTAAGLTVGATTGVEAGADVTDATNVGAALTLTGDVTSSASMATALKTNLKSGTLGITIDGAGSAITTGVKGYLEIPFDYTITQATLTADQSGSIVVDVWKDTYANYPPTDADSITASAPPTITTALKSQDSTLTGWTLTGSKGDVLGFNVDSATTITRATLTLQVTKT
jgi:hypothetical protein